MNVHSHWQLTIAFIFDSQVDSFWQSDKASSMPEQSYEIADTGKSGPIKSGSKESPIAPIKQQWQFSFLCKFKYPILLWREWIKA